MEFNEKLQELRKKKGLTQEELSQKLFVSRTAVSKWESGRGYPNIDSLKAISEFFGITVDELLSCDELLNVAKEDNKEKESGFRRFVFGLLDCSAALFFFLPFFGQKSDDAIREVSLFNLYDIPTYIRAAFFVAVIGIILMGIIALVFQFRPDSSKNKIITFLSLIINAIGAVVFIVTLQPYAAVYLFVLLIIKALMLIKHQ